MSEVDAEDYGEWISESGRWDWWFTGTFGYDASRGVAHRAVDRLVERFDPSRAAFAIESSNEWWKEGLGSNVHIHALLEVGEHGPSPWEGEEWWEGRFGWARVKDFDSDKGASHYVAEYCMKDLLEMQMQWGFYSDGQTDASKDASDVLPF